ncbi:MAG: tetratricopeptide repeat protein [Planctomycetota bacterium]
MPKNRDRSATSTPQGESRLPHGPIVVIVTFAITLASILAYSNGLGGAFLFDDRMAILERSHITDFDPGSADAWAEVLKARRPATDLTFALNYAAGAVEPSETWPEGQSSRGYHIVNLGIHLGVALALLALTVRTLSLTRSETQAANVLIAGAAALLWAVHPLTTQAVTYIVQRGESLMALCYVLTLLFYNLGATTEHRRRIVWFAACIVACGLGMLSKGVMVTAPLAVLLYDRCFLSQTWRASLRGRWPILAGLCATWLLLVVTGVATTTVGIGASARATVGFAYEDHTWHAYLFTQPAVLLHYLRLVVWPDVLILDHEWPFATSIGPALLPGAIILALLVTTLWLLLRRNPSIGFVAVMFFLVLAPTSSFIPLRDPAFEHRMYLPLASVLLLMVLGIDWLARKRLAARPAAVAVALAALVLALPLGMRTAARNADYGSEEAMLEANLAAQPNASRVMINLGRILSMRAGTMPQGPEAAAIRDRAIELFERSIEIQPDELIAHYNLANTVALWSTLAPPEQRADLQRRAHEQFLEAERLAPRGYDPNTAAQHGVLLILMERFDDAAARFEQVVNGRRRVKPETEARAWYGLAIVAERRGDADAALQAYQQALQIQPDAPEVQRALGRLQEALRRRGQSGASGGGTPPSDR